MSHKYTPECPYCARQLGRPEDVMTELGKVLSGKCACGAVYVCDPTGHNTGEAYMEALALLKGDWDINTMDPSFDYETTEMDYDLKLHARVQAKGIAGQTGKLVILREKTGKVEPAAPAEASALPDAGRSTDLKRTIRGALQRNDLAAVVKLGLGDKGAIRRLIGLAYDKEDVTSWRAMEALGLLCRALSLEKKDVVRDTVRKLLWSMGEESGGIGWSAAEMLGEIISNCPDDLSDIVPIVWSFNEELMFRSGVMLAMGRIASVRPEMVREFSAGITEAMSDENPYVRASAAWSAGVLKDPGAVPALQSLCGDNANVLFYSDGNLHGTTVGEVACAAIKKSK